MEDTCTNLTDVVRSVHLLKINGYRMTKTMDSDDGCLKSRWNVYGYDWEVHLYPAGLSGRFSIGSNLALKLIFAGEARTASVRASLGCRLVDPRGKLKPSVEKREAGTFKRPQDSSSAVLVMQMDALENDEVYAPSSGLHQHLRELLQSETGADVTFLVSGESFAAHKAILAARSPALMEEFFGQMKEKSCPRVEVKDMEVAAFKAMLYFIYTDTVPELDEEPLETMVVMARLLVAAADSTPEILDAVMATEGYKELEASCPSVLRELLKSARARKRS
ncbi:unnamed protein product [Alopecurus aequalis]